MQRMLLDSSLIYSSLLHLIVIKISNKWQIENLSLLSSVLLARIHVKVELNV